VKKIFVIALCLIAPLLLYGCITDNEPPKPSAEPEESQEVTSPGPAIEPEESQEGTPTETPPVDTVPDDADAGELGWGAFPFSFTTQDLYGNIVTEETLGKKQLFFVHIWGTWCGPCVNEMPDLAAIAIEYGDRVGFIGLLDDFSSNPDGAKSIKESAGVPDSFITVDAWLAEVSALLELVRPEGYPTTVIIAPDGRQTEKIIGAYGAAYADIIEMILLEG